ncbi:site-2 protease family protein [Chryseomicrobium aureum]|uniref:site-2 protease family protein n=1 Tax=Chryseomicrobium aureum TaxID=1441723 RepID=UPI00370D6F68
METKQRGKSSWKTPLSQFIVGGIAGFAIVSYYFTHDITFSLMSVLSILLIAIASFIFAIILHETGHALAGKLSGMEVMNLSYGPFIYAKTNGASKFYFKAPAMGYIGRAMLRFPTQLPEHEMRRRLIPFIYGGPVANIVVAVSLLIPSYIYGWSGWFTFALVQLFTGLSNLTSMETGGAQTDGRVIAMLKGKEPGADLLLISYKLLQQDPTASGRWTNDVMQEAEEIILRYKNWPLAASLLASVSPYYYSRDPERIIELSEDRAFLERTKQSSILEDITDLSVITNYYYAGRLMTEPGIEEKLRQISDRDKVSRHLRDAYLALISGDKNEAITAIYATEKELGDWHPLYLEATALKSVLRDLLQDARSS